MKIAILGYGLEGQSIANYFKPHGDLVKVFDNFTPDQIPNFHLIDYDLVFRSPSLHPAKDHRWTSATRYFFHACPRPIIGVTGTKGKGTTCSIIAALLESLGQKVHLVGNIGTPALDALDKIKMSDAIVYELSSFQLWDLEESPHVAVVLRIEPDHLNVHDDFNDYISAKANITSHQTEKDFCIYFNHNDNSKHVASLSKGKKFSYPISENRSTLDKLLDNLAIPGAHNRENAEAALHAVAVYLEPDSDFETFLKKYFDTFATALKNFKGLPHRLEFLRELNGVKYYDDNYSSAFPATDVAIKTFENTPTVLIAGGLNKGSDLSVLRNRIFSAPNIKQVILIGESAPELSRGQDSTKFQLANSLEDAVKKAKTFSEQLSVSINNHLTDNQAEHEVIVLMSPGCASFDMFKNFSDRGNQYKALVKKLK